MEVLPRTRRGSALAAPRSATPSRRTRSAARRARRCSPGSTATTTGCEATGRPAAATASWTRRTPSPSGSAAPGYTTAHIGKYLNGYDAGERAARLDRVVRLARLLDLPDVGLHAQRERHAEDVREPGVEDPALYQTDVYRAKAVDFIRRRSGPGRPFYLSVAFLAPHSRGASSAGRRTARRYGRRRGTGQVRRQAAARARRSFNEADVSDKPRLIRNARRSARIRIANLTRNYRARPGVAAGRRRGGARDRGRAALDRRAVTTPTSCSPPTTASSTASTGCRTASCSSTSRHPGAAADPRPRRPSGPRDP